MTTVATPLTGPLPGVPRRPGSGSPEAPSLPAATAAVVARETPQRSRGGGLARSLLIAWATADRDNERQAFEALYDTLYPRPAWDGAS